MEIVNTPSCDIVLCRNFNDMSSLPDHDSAIYLFIIARANLPPADVSRAQLNAHSGKLVVVIAIIQNSPALHVIVTARVTTIAMSKRLTQV